MTDFLLTYQILDTVINPAIMLATKNLPVDDQTVMVFASLPRQITYDETHSAHLPGLTKTTSTDSVMSTIMYTIS